MRLSRNVRLINLIGWPPDNASHSENVALCIWYSVAILVVGFYLGANGIRWK